MVSEMTAEEFAEEHGDTFVKWLQENSWGVRLREVKSREVKMSVI